MSKKLVAYFSASGVTAKVAETHLAETGHKLRRMEYRSSFLK